MNCYNCGKELTAENSTTEHIPARNLFAGLAEEYSQNRITVLGCFECNNSFSGIDEEFRNLIGVINNNDELSTLTKKTASSMVRGKKKIERVLLDKESGKAVNTTFDKDILIEYSSKNFRGVYCNNYGVPISSDFKICVRLENDFDDNSNQILNYLHNFNWQCSGHQDVFKFKLQPFRNNYDFDGVDIIPNGTDNIFICNLVYHNLHSAIVVAERRIIL